MAGLKLGVVGKQKELISGMLKVGILTEGVGTARSLEAFVLAWRLIWIILFGGRRLDFGKMLCRD
jgi:hypothetical protein